MGNLRLQAEQKKTLLKILSVFTCVEMNYEKNFSRQLRTVATLENQIWKQNRTETVRIRRLFQTNPSIKIPHPGFLLIGERHSSSSFVTGSARILDLKIH